MIFNQVLEKLPCRTLHSETPQSEQLSERLGHPPPRPRQPRALALAPQLEPRQLALALQLEPRQLDQEEVHRVKYPFIICKNKLNRRQTHCLECIKDVALHIVKHSREYETGK